MPYLELIPEDKRSIGKLLTKANLFKQQISVGRDGADVAASSTAMSVIRNAWLRSTALPMGLLFEGSTLRENGCGSWEKSNLYQICPLYWGSSSLRGYERVPPWRENVGHTGDDYIFFKV